MSQALLGPALVLLHHIIMLLEVGMNIILEELFEHSKDSHSSDGLECVLNFL